MNKIIGKYIVILSIIPAIYYSFFPGVIVVTTVFCCYSLILLLFLYLKKQARTHIDNKLYINLFIVYNLFILIRGFIDIESDKDWAIILSRGVPVALFLPFILHVAGQTSALFIIFRTFLYSGIPLLLLMLLNPLDPGPFGITHTLSPLYIFILFTPYLNNKVRLLIFALSMFSFFLDITVRANLLNILVAYIISFTFWIRHKRWTIPSIKIVRTSLLTSPVLFLILGLSGIFNIFTVGDFLGSYIIEDGKQQSQDLLVDSRTETYKDVFSEYKDNSFLLLIGLGGSGKTKTSLTTIQDVNYDVVYKEGRPDTESGMLNYIQWGGLFGGFVYMLLFIRASYMGIFKSNNWLCVMVGLWIAYKGLFSFIEDALMFSILSIFVIIPIGMCFNVDLKKMSDDQIQAFIRSVFKIKKQKRIIEAKNLRKTI